VSAPPLQDPTLRLLEQAENYNDWLLARARPYVHGRVLDFGAGIGTFSVALAPLAQELVVVEPDAAFAAALRERLAGVPHARVVATDALEPGSVDAIVCFNVLEHIPDDVAVMRRFAELLRPGGHALVLVPGHQALYGGIDRAVSHQRRYSKRQLGDRLRDAGFDLVELRRVNPVGAAGWLVWSRLLGRDVLPAGPTKVYDKLVPLLRMVDRVELPVGLSVWAVARRG
jgi:SAM-dependent methyltransferase